MTAKDIIYKLLGGEIMVKAIWWLFSFLPLANNKVLCQSFWGVGYSDNPRAIADEIRRQGLGYKIMWVVRDDAAAKSLPRDIKPVRTASIALIYHMSTAKFWIDNSRKLSYARKKPGQLYIQTWHGFPLKKIEQDAESKLSDTYVAAARRDSKMCDLMISNGTFLTELYKNSFWYSGEVLECGSPRNDLLFKSDTKTILDVKRNLGVAANQKILLYAPTFRSDQGIDAYDLGYEKTLRDLANRFGSEWVVLVRLHPNVAEKSNDMDIYSGSVRDVSAYADVQNLLLASDALITDYSSLMFDFMLMQKPCFLYANDIEKYVEDRGFYYGIDTLPFDVAETQAALSGIIHAFEFDAYSKRIGHFMRGFGFCEPGLASHATVGWMSSRLQREEKEG